MRTQEHKSKDTGRRDMERKFEFIWVTTAETGTVRYEKKYRSYLKEMYNNRHASNLHAGKKQGREEINKNEGGYLYENT